MLFLMLLLAPLSVFGKSKYFQNDFDRDPGIALGYLPYCSGVEKPAYVTESYLSKHMPITIQTKIDQKTMLKKRHPYYKAASAINAEHKIDFKNKKTVLFISGWVDTSNMLFSETVANSFSRKGYNVLVVDTHWFTIFPYPISSRLAKVVGNVTAEFIAKLKDLNPKNLTLIGFSLGGQTVGFVGRYYERFTGTKIGQIFGVDPSGPCFRFLPPSGRLNPDDADVVQVMHTNNEVFGMPKPMGDVDFYVNGGEFQTSFSTQAPCVELCSHFRSYLLLHSMLFHTHDFVGVRCKNVQQAREANCYENDPVVTNTMSLEAVDPSKPGVYYLPTTNRWPFYVKDGVKNKYNQAKSVINRLNNEEVLVLNEEFQTKAEPIFNIFQKPSKNIIFTAIQEAFGNLALQVSRLFRIIN